MAIITAKTDRRWVRTHKNIRAAFAALLIQKDLGKITVKEIVAIADINRNTFYLHYSNVGEVMEEIENEIIAALTTELESIEFSKLSSNPSLFYKSLTHLLTADVDLHTAILRSIKSSTLSLQVKQVLKNKLSTALAAQHHIDPLVLEISIEFLTSGMIAVYQHWFLSDKSYTLDEVSKVVSRMLARYLAELVE